MLSAAHSRLETNIVPDTIFVHVVANGELAGARVREEREK
jgi:hypothetical protein